ncbi:MAG: 16S rRNA processing protein RimM [Clostridia bacterium]|nr:16S rRNA processing protein RimM [Clostridia bacterium]
MENTLKVGLIVKPQGIRGELKVQPLTDDINRFKKLKNIIIDGKNYRVTNATIAGNVVLLSIFGISDRDTAETFRDKFICVDRENAVPLEEGRYFIADIIGSTLKTDHDSVVGEIVEVTSARTDIFTVKCTDGTIMRFPFLKDAIVNIDIENKLIIVKAKRLSEIACYEN